VVEGDVTTSGAGSAQPAPGEPRTPGPSPDDAWAGAPADLRELLALASDLARAAGRVHAEGRREALRLETKSSPTDLVSQVDTDAERLIVDGIHAARPHDAILGEEGTSRGGTSGVRWVVDPLDGTTNYVYGYPAYAVSIAVEVDGEARIGVVLDSSADRLHAAVAGHGARCDGAPIGAREPEGLSTALVATGFSYAAAERELDGAVIAAVLGRIRDIRRGGTAALDLCHVAAGRVDAYWELDLSPWDYAAGALIAREAGAEVRLAPAAYGRGSAVISTHPSLMPAFVDLLREAGALA
jgi:myo-inositol-1(or 4)-monophosphatase